MKPTTEASLADPPVPAIHTATATTHQAMHTLTSTHYRASRSNPLGRLPGQGKADGTEGGRVVQDRGAQFADADGGEAVVAGQAVALARAPQVAVVAAGAARA